MKCYFMGPGAKRCILVVITLLLAEMILEFMESDFIGIIFTLSLCIPLIGIPLLAWNKPLIKLDENKLELYNGTKKPDEYLLSEIEIFKEGASMISILNKKENKVNKILFDLMALSKTDREDFKRTLSLFLKKRA